MLNLARKRLGLFTHTSRFMFSKTKKQSKQSTRAKGLLYAFLFGAPLILRQFYILDTSKQFPQFTKVKDQLKSKGYRISHIDFKQNLNSSYFSTTVNLQNDAGSTSVQKVKISNPNLFAQQMKDEFGDFKSSVTMSSLIQADKLFWDIGAIVLFVGVLSVINKNLSGKINANDFFKHQHHQMESVTTKFKDVIGIDNSKLQIIEFVQFLKNPQKYKKLGAKLPRGALMTGPPGTGKTLMARACAGQAGVPFFYSSGSQYVQKFVGKGASRVRDLFKQAKDNSPSIIFIDEIDAIASKRGGHGSGVEEQNTLNQLLVEMDGFDLNENVVVLGATNRPQILDPALLRPGRFDRKIDIPLPAQSERQQIVQFYLKKIKLEETLNIEQLTKYLSAQTAGFSGADINNLCNQAAILAGRSGSSAVGRVHIDQGLERVLTGIDKKKLLTSEDKKIIAYQQAGRAVVNWLSWAGDPIIKILLISGHSYGLTQFTKKERVFLTKQLLVEKMSILAASRAAQLLFLGQATESTKKDIVKLNQLAYDFIAKYGMSDSQMYNSVINDSASAKTYSAKTANRIDQQVSKLVLQAQRKANEVMTDKRQLVVSLASILLQKETISKEEVLALLGPPAFK